MPHPPRIIGYEGADTAQILEHFEADAQGAEEHDWYPISQTWTDGALCVEYEHDPDRRLRAAVRMAAKSRQRSDVGRRVRAAASGSHDWVPSVIVVGLIVAAVVGVSMVAFSPGDQPAGVAGESNARPTPRATVDGGSGRSASGPGPTQDPGQRGPITNPSHRPRKSPGSSAGSSVATFKDGIWEVGEDIAPGTYRTMGAEGCYWSRLRRLTGRQRDVIVDENTSGPAIVTIERRDVGFESARCRSWTSDLGRITESRTEFGDGTYLVGVDIIAGTYRSRGTTPCYWERLRGFAGDRDEIIAAGTDAGRRTVTIRGSDKGFSSIGCGTWTRIRR